MKRILVVDDHAVVRAGVKNIFNEQGDVATFGEASTAEEALTLARTHPWDVVILDLTLGDRSGLEVLKELRQACPQLPVLILSMHSEEQYARRAFRAGAAGYITKNSARDDLVRAVNKVIVGGRYVSAALAANVIEALEKDRAGPPHTSLSDREFEVLRLIGSGKTVGEIAEILALSDKTISTYRARILEKMGMRTSAELMHYAVQNKLVD